MATTAIGEHRQGVGSHGQVSQRAAPCHGAVSKQQGLNNGSLARVGSPGLTSPVTRPLPVSGVLEGGAEKGNANGLWHAGGNLVWLTEEIRPFMSSEQASLGIVT